MNNLKRLLSWLAEHKGVKYQLVRLPWEDDYRVILDTPGGWPLLVKVDYRLAAGYDLEALAKYLYQKKIYGND